MREVEAVIFDYGGVFSNQLFAGLERFEATMGYPEGSLVRLLFGDGTYIRGGGGDPCDGASGEDEPVPDFHRLERGEITLDEYVDRIRARAPEVLGTEIDLDAYQRYLTTVDYGVHWPVVHHARDLRDRGLSLAMLTNNVREFSDTWRSTFPIDDLFGVVVDSSHVGMRKPESEIYLLTCERVGVQPTCTVFVDDNADNCAAADRLGIEAIRFLDPWSSIAEIDAVLEQRGIRTSP